MTRRDELQLRMEIDGKQAISELGKQELAAYEYRQELKQISEEQTALEAESKKLDKVRERYEKITKEIKELEAAGKTNTKQYEKLVGRLGNVSEQLRKAEQAQKDLTESQKRFTETSKNLDVTKGKITSLRGEMGLAGMTMRQLRQYQKDLSREMDSGVTKGTQRYEELKRKIKEVNSAMNRQKSDVNGTSSAWSKVRGELTKFGVMALGFLGAQEILGRVQNLVKGAAELSDSLADVQKTTGLTKDEVNDLSNTLGDFNTRTARKELLEMAEIAGRLGITGKKDIEGFVRAADMINVSLGDSLGDVNTVMRDLGKLTSTYNIKEAYGIEESLLKVGSALNELGMASTANEGNIVDFTRRMGGIAPLAKISIQDIMGMGAALDAMGQTSEVSSTALSKLFVNMAKNSKEYARFAKMEVADFVKLMNEDANEAFIRVLEGVKDNSAGITQLAGTLGDLGEDGGRVIGVLGTLSNKVQFLREQQELSNKAFFESTSIFEEFQVKNENLAANLMKVQKAFNGWFINTDFMKFLEATIGVLAKWVTIPLSEVMEKDRASMNLLYRQIVDVNTSSTNRIKLINEMKTMYPDMLGNINAETISNEELGRSIKRVNDQLINKIILQEQDEEIADQNARAAKSKKHQLEAERELMQKMQKTAQEYNLEIQEGVSLVDAATKLANEAGTKMKFWEVLDSNNLADQIFNDIREVEGAIKAVNRVEGETNILLEQREDLIGRLGMAMNTDFVTGASSLGRGAAIAGLGTTDAGSGDGSPELTDEEKKAKEAAAKSAKEKYDALLKEYQAYEADLTKLQIEAEIGRLDKDSQEYARIEQKYQTMREQALGHFNSGMMDQEAYNLRITEINALQDEEVNAKIDIQSQAIKDKRKKLQEDIELMGMDEQEKALEQEERKWQELIEQAQALGLDTVELERLRLEAIAALNDEYDQKKLKKTEETNDKQLKAERELRSAQVALITEYSNLATAAIDLVGKKGGELTTFQKVLALAQIGIDVAVAIMKADLTALQQASVAGPAAMAVYTAAKVGLVASILTSAARAKDLLSSSSVPTYSASSESSSPASKSNTKSRPKKSFFFGGETGEGMGFGDEYGEYAGYVHRHEYVIPQAVRQEPIVKMQIEPMLEALRMKSMSGRSFYNGGDTSSIQAGATPTGNTGMGSDPEIKQLLRQLVKGQQKAKNKKVILVNSELEDFQAEKVQLANRYSAKP